MQYINPHGSTCPWYEITEKTGAPNIKWCEETLCQWISEPANTWSNLGFIIIGLFILYISIKNKHNFQLKQFGPIVFFMGAMSFFYHLSNFYLSQILDFVGMYFFVGWAIGMNLVRLEKLSKKMLLWFNLVLAISLTVLMHAMYVLGVHFQVLILIFAFFILATEFLVRKKVAVSYKWLYISLGLLGMALSFSIIDGKRIWCDSTAHGWFSHGHALWHWLGSIAMYPIYLHYAQPALKPKDD